MTDTLRHVELVSAPPVEHLIADYLQQLLGPARPRRVAQMLDPGGDKYRDLPKSKPLTWLMLEGHAAGVSTYAATLDQDGMSRAGVIEIDQGGRSAVLATLRAAHKLGLVCYAIAVDNPLSGHAGGHVYFPYLNIAPVADIVAQLQQVATAAGQPDVEIWPCGQVIRLPFGYHRWAKTRGQLLTQDGQIVDLDSDLASGFFSISALIQNAAPPEMTVNNGIDPIVSNCADWAPKKAAAQTSDKAHYTIRRESPGEAAAGRASLDDVKARFNAEYTIASVLDRWGKATETRDGWACACGVGHTHATTLYISKLGRLFSYSPRCLLHTTKGYDAFGLYVLLFHNNNVTAALKELNPIQPRQRPPAAPQRATVYRTPEMDADAERRRAERRAAATATLAEIQARASADATLSDRAQLVLLALLETAGTRDWTRASVARLAELTELCERYVHEGLRELEQGAYISSGRRNGSTTFRTFIRLQAYVKCADEYIYIACEGAAPLPPTLPDWQLAKVNELGAMDDAAFTAWYASHNFTPKSSEPCSQGEAGLQQIAAPKKAALTLSTEQPEQNAVDLPNATHCNTKTENIQNSSTQKSAFVHNPTRKSALGPTDLTPEKAHTADNNDYTKIGAEYTPVELPSHKPYTGITKHTQDTEARYALVWSSMRRIEHADDSDQAEQLPLEPTKPRKVSDKPRAIDLYLVELAGMSPTELAGEKKRQQRTIAKFEGQYWLDKPDGPCDRLALVEREIDARDMAGVPIAPRSQAPALARQQVLL